MAEKRYTDEAAGCRKASNLKCPMLNAECPTHVAKFEH
jgi:hypothetical protein